MRRQSDLLAIAALAIATHATALGGGFIWLDHTHLEEGLALAKPADWPGLFTRGFAGTGFYRPLVSLSLSLDASLSATPALFRAVTLAWHAAAAVMTMVAGQALGLSRRAALMAALLFAVHPLTSLVAGAIAFRSEAMTLVALLALVTYHRRQKPILAALAVFAGALTKETAWVLGPLLVAALELERRLSVPAASDDEKPRVRLLVAEGMALTLASVVRAQYAPGWRASFEPLSLEQAIGTRFSAFAKSAAALVAPVDRSICDAFPVSSLGSLPAVAGACALLALGVCAWFSRGPAWLFALSLLPTLNLVPVMRWWSPHYLYVPLAFGSLWLAQKLDGLGKRAVFGAAAAGVLCSALSLHDGYRYRSDVALWTPEVRRRPQCLEGQFFLGDAARVAENWDRAAEHYQRAASAVPGYLAYVDRAAALQNLGAMRWQQRRLGDAKAAWTAALELSQDAVQQRKLTNNLATLALETGNPNDAQRLLEAETARANPLPEALLVRAEALHALGREREAAELMRRFLRSAQR